MEVDFEFFLYIQRGEEISQKRENFHMMKE
jgi:hypothetical protein